MARILSQEGLIMNQANRSTGYMRLYSFAYNNSGPMLRFNISAGNPPVHVYLKIYSAFTQTNGSSDFNSSLVKFNSLYVGTGGTPEFPWYFQWTSGHNTDIGWTNSTTRQVDMYLMTSNVGGFPGKGSIMLEMYSNEWNWITLTRL